MGIIMIEPEIVLHGWVEVGFVAFFCISGILTWGILFGLFGVKMDHRHFELWYAAEQAKKAKEEKNQSS